MINIKVFNVTQLATNCCYLVDKTTGKSAVTDPGDKSEKLISEIEKNGGKKKKPQPAPAPVPQMSAEEKAKRDKIVIDYLYAHPADEQWYLEKSGKKDMLELNLDNVYIHLKQNNKI